LLAEIPKGGVDDEKRLLHHRQLANNSSLLALPTKTTVIAQIRDEL
jgi:hypothetical protein